MTNELHSFHPSAINVARCSYCERPWTEHTTCESCGVENSKLILFGKLLICSDCQKREYAAAVAATNVHIQEHSNATIIRSQEIDQSIHLSSDLFNAQTVPIVELESAIDTDDTIPTDKKQYTKAATLQERLEIFQSRLIERKREVIELENAVRAHQQRLNQLRTELTAMERVELGMPQAPINVPTVKVPKAPAIPKKRMTAEDNAIASMMKTLGCDEKTARELVRGVLKTADVKCTCLQTPGLCPIHDKA